MSASSVWPSLAVAAAAWAAPVQAARAQRPDLKAITADLQHLLDSLLTTDSTLPGLSLHVEAPALGLSWTGSAGVADLGTRAPLTPRTAYRMASNTKTYVAAAILSLWEQGKLGLDRPIADYLLPATVALLRRGGYDPAAITVRHLLTHTGGVYDWGDSPEYAAMVTADPHHRWSRAEQVTLAMEKGKPYGNPGEVFRYSDTGYCLLGEILERVTGLSWPESLRRTLPFDRLKLRQTWLESLEPVAPDVSGRAHQYLGTADTYDFDPSLDLWGGGGYAATMHDMAVFTRALFTRGVYRRPTTADTMLTAPQANDGPAYRGGSRMAKAGPYRMGIAVMEIAGATAYIHGGFWGTFSLYLPDWDVGLAGVQTQQQSRAMGSLQSGAITILRRHLGSRR